MLLHETYILNARNCALALCFSVSLLFRMHVSRWPELLGCTATKLISLSRSHLLACGELTSLLLCFFLHWTSREQRWTARKLDTTSTPPPLPSPITRPILVGRLLKRSFSTRQYYQPVLNGLASKKLRKILRNSWEAHAHAHRRKSATWEETILKASRSGWQELHESKKNNWH